MKETHHSQFEESLIMGNMSPKQTEERVMRRLVLEILPHLIPWAETKNKDSTTISTLKETLRRKENFSRVNQNDWKELLEEFLEKNLELVILKNPLELKDMRPGKNPLVKRMEEIGEHAAEETLIVGWHISSGLLAASFPCPDASLNRYFPKIQTRILIGWSRPEDPKDPICLWTWDRTNFLPSS